MMGILTLLLAILMKTDKRVLGSALMLYEGLGEDTRLNVRDRVKLIPKLVTLVMEHGAKVHITTKYIDLVVDEYLEDGHQRALPARNGRLRDRHASERKIIYGSDHAEIPYGIRTGYVGKRTGKVQSSRVPSAKMVRKAAELVKSINIGRWREATERYHDLTQLQGHLFYLAQTYRQFLTEMGSIILQRSKAYKVNLWGIELNGFPDSYIISHPPNYRTSEEDVVADPEIRKAKVPTVKMPHSRRITVAPHWQVSANGSVPKSVHRPHPTLERRIAQSTR